MAAASELRLQKERQAELSMQRSDQRDGIIHAEKKLQRLKDQLNELRVASENIDPSNLIAQLQVFYRILYSSYS
uniref:Myosin_tail_1 domain-containing protein n=1 Tax=Angiostrongylus cantonensis TaxID=6313 RepID=A0A0K0D8U1_ANGCA